MIPIAVARRTEATVLICEARPMPIAPRPSAKVVMRRVATLTIQISAQVKIKTPRSAGRSWWAKLRRAESHS